MKLSNEEQGILLLSARESIKTLYEDVPIPEIDYRQYPQLANKAGAFVTLRKNNHLRGCIGYIYSDMTVFDTVCDAAKLAATEDPRFPPLLNTELSQIQIEISVLSIPRQITNYSEIKLGEHGLIVEEDDGRGLLLPQVATEHNMTLEGFLSAICEKAGLDTYLWRKKILNLKVFSAEVFQEKIHRHVTNEKS
jgi:AmmeMemoRadiSam system protein A